MSGAGSMTVADARAALVEALAAKRVDTAAAHMPPGVLTKVAARIACGEWTLAGAVMLVEKAVDMFHAEGRGEVSRPETLAICEATIRARCRPDGRGSN